MALTSQIIFNGLVLMATYALVACGLALVFGVMKILNFAQGELYMVGAYVVYWLYAESHVPFIVAVLAAGCVAGCLGLAMELSIFRRLRMQPFMGFIASLGVSAILQVAVMVIFGSSFQGVPSPEAGNLQFLGSHFTFAQIFIIGTALALLGILAGLLQKTKWGLGIQASASDRDAAALVGMNLNWYAAGAMTVSAAMAGLAGAIIAPTTTLSPLMGTQVILPAFAIVIIGGAGSIKGALIASALVAFVQSIVTTTVNANISVGAALLVMLLVLTFKPTGLFAR